MHKELSKEVLQANCGDLIFDWSYQFLSVDSIIDYANSRLPFDFDESRNRLLNGSYRNVSESREVTHAYARCSSLISGLTDNSAFVRMVNKLRNGQWLGATSKPISDIVNIGVGGSDLGPLMASFALKEFSSDVNAHVTRTHFVSSMDGGQLYTVLPIVDPETTLFIITSKSFSTIDTFANVATVQAWIEGHFQHCGVSVHDWLERHVIGVSASAKRMTEFGIPSAHQLTFPDSIGGRYSMWSAAGLAIATSCGIQVFRRLLKGAVAMDEHFASAAVIDNIPILMALIGLYNREERDINNLAILPYDGRFRHLPSYLQQLDMESNGKQYSAKGEVIEHPTAPIVWGGFGPNGQHAFFQYLHQGFDKFTADFVMVLNRTTEKFTAKVRKSLQEQQDLSVANCLAHRRLMAFGQVGEAAEENFPGGHPTSLLALKELTPEGFGSIIAAYEHKVFVQGLAWGINSFDQPGVELGKRIAKDTYAAMKGEIPHDISKDMFDCSTNAFIKWRSQGE